RFNHRQRRRIRGRVGAADLSEDPFDLRKLLQFFIHLLQHPSRFPIRQAGQCRRHIQDRAFVGFRQKIFSDTSQQECGGNDGKKPCASKDVPVLDHQPEGGSIPCHSTALAEILSGRPLTLVHPAGWVAGVFSSGEMLAGLTTPSAPPARWLPAPLLLRLCPVGLALGAPLCEEGNIPSACRRKIQTTRIGSRRRVSKVETAIAKVLVNANGSNKRASRCSRKNTGTNDARMIRSENNNG